MRHTSRQRVNKENVYNIRARIIQLSVATLNNSTLRLIRVKHQFRSDFLVEFLGGQEAQRNRSFLQSRALLVRLLCALGNICEFYAYVSTHPHSKVYLRTVVAQVAVEDGSQHERLVEDRFDALLVRLDANDAVLGERSRSYSGSASPIRFSFHQ